jgi:hypothetical protein
MSGYMFFLLAFNVQPIDAAVIDVLSTANLFPTYCQLDKNIVDRKKFGLIMDIYILFTPQCLRFCKIMNINLKDMQLLKRYT